MAFSALAPPSFLRQTWEFTRLVSFPPPPSNTLSGFFVRSPPVATAPIPPSAPVLLRDHSSHRHFRLCLRLIFDVIVRLDFDIAVLGQGGDGQCHAEGGVNHRGSPCSVFFCKGASGLWDVRSLLSFRRSRFSSDVMMQVCRPGRLLTPVHSTHPHLLIPSHFGSAPQPRRPLGPHPWSLEDLATPLSVLVIVTASQTKHCNTTSSLPAPVGNRNANPPHPRRGTPPSVLGGRIRDWALPPCASFSLWGNGV